MRKVILKAWSNFREAQARRPISSVIFPGGPLWVWRGLVLARKGFLMHAPRHSRAVVAALAVAVVAVSVALFALPASAGSQTGSITVKSSVANNCTSSVTQPGTITYDPISANLSTAATDSSGSLVLNCTKGDSVSVDMDKGSNSAAAGSYFQPQMAGQTTGNTDKLQYNMYTTSGYTTVWGSNNSADGGTTHGSAQTTTGLGPGTAHKITLTLYIQIPATQNVSADTYQDTMTATITY